VIKVKTLLGEGGQRGVKLRDMCNMDNFSSMPGTTVEIALELSGNALILFRTGGRVHSYRFSTWHGCCLMFKETMNVGENE